MFANYIGLLLERDYCFATNESWIDRQTHVNENTRAVVTPSRVSSCRLVSSYLVSGRVQVPTQLSRLEQGGVCHAKLTLLPRGGTGALSTNFSFVVRAGRGGSTLYLLISRTLLIDHVFIFIVFLLKLVFLSLLCVYVCVG